MYKHKDCLLCGKTRKVIKDSLRKNRNTMDLSRLPRVLSKSLVYISERELVPSGVKNKKKKKKEKKEKKEKKKKEKTRKKRKNKIKKREERKKKKEK